MAALSQSPNASVPDYAICNYFARLRDPRRARRRRHHLQDIVAIALCAVIAGAQDWKQIATFGRARIDGLRGFLALPNGSPSHDTFERVFSRLRPGAFQACFRQWVKAITHGLQLRHVAVDGKTQGQLPLSRYARENLEEEALVPAAELAFERDTLLARMLLQE